MHEQELDSLRLTDEQKTIMRANHRKWHVKPGPPIITIFVRHSANCKYRGDEFEKRCHCPKHLRWTHERKQHRVSAHTLSWAVAEDKKREIEDQLAGRTPVVKPEQEQRTRKPALTSSSRTREAKVSLTRLLTVHSRAGPDP
jgi:hypothetical protein